MKHISIVLFLSCTCGYSFAKIFICTPRLTSSRTFSQSIRVAQSAAMVPGLATVPRFIIRDTVLRCFLTIFAIARSERPCLNSSKICSCIAIVTLIAAISTSGNNGIIDA